MMIVLGLNFSQHSAPEEVAADSPIPAKERIKQWRSCAGWALIWGRFAHPCTETLPAMLYYVETHLMLNRTEQMNCYLLSGVNVRLMLKMGLHRDPSKMTNVTPFEGEMRRRLWNMAIQVDLVVSFHMGLPAMIQGIEADTMIPRNLHDEDFDEDSAELPPARPESEWTPMTYATNKSKILRVFVQIARQAHALSPPTHGEIMRVDDMLQETWKGVPEYMKPKPIEECVGLPPGLIIQRLGLENLYHKCRCVLHRRYLAEAISKPQHDYNRGQCLDAALSLLDNQYTMWDSCRPGRLLRDVGWWVTALVVHDLLLAAMVIYVILQGEQYPEQGGPSEWRAEPLPPKDLLRERLRMSHAIWLDVSKRTPETKKAALTVATMLSRLGIAETPDTSVSGACSSNESTGDPIFETPPYPEMSVPSKFLAMSVTLLTFRLCIWRNTIYPSLRQPGHAGARCVDRCPHDKRDGLRPLVDIDDGRHGLGKSPRRSRY